VNPRSPGQQARRNGFRRRRHCRAERKRPLLPGLQASAGAAGHLEDSRAAAVHLDLQRPAPRTFADSPRNRGSSSLEGASSFGDRALRRFSRPWLEQRLTAVESRAYAAAGDIRAAFATAGRAGRESSLEVAVTLAHAWLAAGDSNKARRALMPALASRTEVPERVRLQACLVDARLSYDSGDVARGRRALESALRLAAPEQLRLPFTIERRWIRPVLRRDPALAHTHRCLLEPTLHRDQFPARLIVPQQVTVGRVEPLTDREREVLRHVSGILSSAEIAREMYISINTVKTHLRNIYRKLAATHRGDAVRRARQLELI
jgi:LuxR family transcriptional regulator, maltose regulon positive regulatory protein